MTGKTRTRARTLDQRVRDKCRKAGLVFHWCAVRGSRPEDHPEATWFVTNRVGDVVAWGDGTIGDAALRLGYTRKWERVK